MTASWACSTTSASLRSLATIGLRSWFLDPPTVRAGAACLVHLGIMHGALAAWDAAVTVDRLEPFVQPDLCLAHVAPVGSRR